VISDQSERMALIRRYSALNDCLQTLSEDEVADQFSTIDILLKLFMIFVGGDPYASRVTQQTQIDLQSSQDPAVARLRDEIGVPAAAGWIFIQFYDSTQEMPEIIRAAFDDPQIDGVTFLSRYIVVLNPTQASWTENALQNQSQRATISHELVHAYIHSAIADHTNILSIRLPKWFEEGLATYISRSASDRSIITPTYSLSESAPADYQHYAQTFNYLEKRLGKQKLDENIRQSVQTNDPSQLYKELGIPDDRWLDATVTSWERQQTNRRAFLGLLSLGILLSIVYLSLPELVCECGFSGRNRDFLRGQCPKCGQPVAGARRAPLQKPIALVYPDCQVCGRRFFPWQRRQLQIQRRWRLVWIESPMFEGPPLPRYVRRVCQPCFEHGKAIAANYQQVVHRKIEHFRNVNRPVFEKWLANAPFSENINADQVDLSFEQAVDLVMDCALAAVFGDWIESIPKFRFTFDPEFCDDQFELLMSPPAYHGVIFSEQTTQIGSISRSSQFIFSISWEI
jgi:hypothetical protein